MAKFDDGLRVDSSSPSAHLLAQMFCENQSSLAKSIGRAKALARVEGGRPLHAPLVIDAEFPSR